MCNLYSATTNQEAVRRLFPKISDRVGNLPALATIYPDQEAPIIRNGAAGAAIVEPPPSRRSSIAAFWSCLH